LTIAIVEASEYFAPLKMSAKCSAPMKKTAGTSTSHFPGTGFKKGAKHISTRMKRSAVKNTGGI